MINFLVIIIIFLLCIIFYLLSKNKSKPSSKEIKKTSENENVEIFEIEESPLIQLSKDNRESINQEVISNLESITKKEAIQFINHYSELDNLSFSNTSFSNINKTVPIWWFNITPDKFEKDLHLILAKKKSFIWIKLPEGSVLNPERKFRLREDKGLIEIKISYEAGNNYLKDISSGGIEFGFKQFVQKEFKI
jgi:cbb3-type cytochrome oxidase subunit 3